MLYININMFVNVIWRLQFVEIWPLEINSEYICDAY